MGEPFARATYFSIVPLVWLSSWFVSNLHTSSFVSGHGSHGFEFQSEQTEVFNLTSELRWWERLAATSGAVALELASAGYVLLQLPGDRFRLWSVAKETSHTSVSVQVSLDTASLGPLPPRNGFRSRYGSGVGILDGHGQESVHQIPRISDLA